MDVVDGPFYQNIGARALGAPKDWHPDLTTEKPIHPYIWNINYLHVKRTIIYSYHNYVNKTNIWKNEMCIVIIISQ